MANGWQAGHCQSSLLPLPNVLPSAPTSFACSFARDKEQNTRAGSPESGAGLRYLGSATFWQHPGAHTVRSFAHHHHTLRHRDDHVRILSCNHLWVTLKAETQQPNEFDSGCCNAAMETRRGRKRCVFGVMLLRKEQQKRCTTVLTSAAPELPNRAKHRQKWLHPIPTCKTCLVVEFQLSKQPRDDHKRGCSCNCHGDAAH